MADPTVADTGTGGAKGISAAARSALHKLAAPEAVSVMEDMLRVASGGNNNNNNNGGGSVLSREQLLQKVSTSLSDDQLHAVLKQQGVI
jgi:hypothetical protein